MKKSFLSLYDSIDMSRVLDETRQLFEIELPQTFDAYHASADKAVELLKKSGIPQVEKISFPADGKTAYQDKIMPMGWNASSGKAVIISAEGIAQGTVIADYREHPFYLIKGSTSTLPGGEDMPLLTCEAVLAGADPTGALVLSPLDQDCRCRALKTLLDRGARGVISDFSFNKEDAPEGILWNTAFTEFDNWHVNADDRNFLAFSIPPATGKRLRDALAKAPVLLHIESDGNRFESTFDLVTGLIPGRRKEELWLYAHLYEPLANDNSSGVAAAVEIARQVMAQGEQEFSLRLLLGLEHYGFAAYASMRGDKNLAGEVIGACDCDAMRIRNDWGLDLHWAAPGTPFYGNFLLRQLADELDGLPGQPRITCCNSFSCMYDDDSFLSDSTTGVATIWPIRSGNGIYHNSLQKLSYIQSEALRHSIAFNAAWVLSTLSPQKEMLLRAAESAKTMLDEELQRLTGSQQEHMENRKQILLQVLQNFSRIFPAEDIKPCCDAVDQYFQTLLPTLSDRKTESAQRSLAAKLIPSRLTVGFPFDLAKVPFARRRLLPGSVLYGPLAAILSNMDGKKDLASIIRKVEHEICRLLSDQEIAEQMDALEFLAQYRYIKLTRIHE